jgi:hypothetical protein
VLIGRDAERERVERLVRDARTGGGGVLLVHGDPGIGKTALLEHARAVAGGMTVLTARGVESESEIPFAGMWDLLSPVLELRDRLPPAQATALGQALALEATGTPARFAVPAAVLGLLGVAAEDGPLVVLVDDVQWLDAPSVEAIVFSARRLHAEGIAMLLGARDGSGRDIDAAGISRMRLEALPPNEAVELLRRTHGDRIGGAVAAGLVEQAAGIPLALVELPRSLSEAQLTGREALPPVLPAGGSLEAAFRSQLAGLTADARSALLVAAAADGGEELVHVRAAIEHLGLAGGALDASEAANVVAVDGGRVRFRHPLLRAAAYHAAAPSERRAAHRALAETAPPGPPRGPGTSRPASAPPTRASRATSRTPPTTRAAAAATRRRDAPSPARPSSRPIPASAPAACSRRRSTTWPPARSSRPRPTPTARSTARRTRSCARGWSASAPTCRSAPGARRPGSRRWSARPPRCATRSRSWPPRCCSRRRSAACSPGRGRRCGASPRRPGGSPAASSSSRGSPTSSSPRRSPRPATPAAPPSASRRARGCWWRPTRRRRVGGDGRRRALGDVG